MLSVLACGLIGHELGEVAAPAPIIASSSTLPNEVPSGPPPPPRDRASLVRTNLARPLFAPQRRPGEAKRVVQAVVRAETVPRLTGIVVSAQARQAIFALPDDRRALIVHEGERIGAYRVTAIAARQVALEGPAGGRIVTMGADPAARSQLVIPPVPSSWVDPFRREKDTENDQ